MYKIIQKEMLTPNICRMVVEAVASARVAVDSIIRRFGRKPEAE